MIRKFRICVQGESYEVEVEQLTSAAVEAKEITPPPAPKRVPEKKVYCVSNEQTDKA